ncbi:uncharacterized protein LOC105700411 isoform X2 [Orussus abietinus]|nr:uncharacterized protein LOC105700411 isoform X2 [Orussus abietinus]
MKCFPRDPVLRKVWKDRVGRADWEPSNNSFLCHVHFESEQWVVSPNGKLKLRKDAVPSIFTITSTRKSTRKRMDVDHFKDNVQSHFTKKYLQKDLNNFLLNKKYKEKFGLTKDCISMSGIQMLQDLINCGKVKEEEEESIYQVFSRKSIMDLEKDNIIIMTNTHNKEIGTLINDNNFIIVDNEIGQIMEHLESTEAEVVIKTEEESRAEEDSIVDNSYDEIEEKLKQICDGEYNSNKSFIDKRYNGLTYNEESIETNEIENTNKGHIALDNSEIKPSLSDSSNTQVNKHKLTNIETIFGIGSGDESTRFDSTKSDSVTISDKLDISINEEIAIGSESLDVKDVKLISADRTNFNKEKSQPISTVMLTMKRKRKSRDEDMKTIKSSLKDVPKRFRTHANAWNSFERKLKTPRNSFSNDTDDSATNEPPKFTIKVTGMAEDVTEIIKELNPKTAVTYEKEELKVSSGDHQGKSYVTSVIAVEDSTVTFLEHDLKRNGHLIQTCSRESKGMENNTPKKIMPSSRRRKHVLKLDGSSVSNSHFVTATDDSLGFEELYGKSSAEHHNKIKTKRNFNDSQMTISSQCLSTECETRIDDPTKTSSDTFKELLEKINIQQRMIEKLTNQVALYKELETKVILINTNLQAKNREIEALTRKTKMINSNSYSQSDKVRYLFDRKLFEEMANRVAYLEDTNNRLTKTMTETTQLKRKLGGQLKQRDVLIKELNWKLEKASKYLERAEKNTNTYKRKMLNMQNVFKRRKLIDERRDEFKEMLIDNITHQFSEQALATALDIRQTCGKDGYRKLLSYNFPLPTLETLHRHFQINDSSSNKESVQGATKQSTSQECFNSYQANAIEQASNGHRNVTIDKIEDFEEIHVSDVVTGTVQDIFDEDNDDRLSTSDLDILIFAHLNAAV